MGREETNIERANHHPRDERGGFSIAIAALVYAFYASILVVFALFKLLGIRGIEAVLPLSLLATLLAAAILHRHLGVGASGGRRKLLAAFSVLLVGSAGLAAIFDDTSYDGRWYHQEGIIRLKEGFDPLRERLREDRLPENGLWSLAATGQPITSAPIWINHYPKSSEITAASVYACTGSIEFGKLFNFLLAFGMAALVHGIARLRFPGHPWRAVALGAALAANPVVIAQAWTYYNDGQLYCLIGGAIGFLILHLRDRGWIWLACAGAALVGLANVKFTGLVYGSVVVAGFCLHVLLRSGFEAFRKTAGTLALVQLVGAALVGYNPYVRNFAENGHPFHPVMGANRIDIVGRNAAPGFENDGRLWKFAQCVMGRTSTDFELRDGRIPPKVPFTFTAKEFREASNPYVHVGGFGPFFSGLLLVSIVAWATSLLRRSRSGGGKRPLLEILRSNDALATESLVALLLATSLANPEMWWSRYVPQLWALPFLLWIPWLDSPRPPEAAFLSFLGVGLAGCAAILVSAIALNARNTSIVERDFQRMEGTKGALKVYFGQWTADRLKYADHSIEIVPVDLPGSVSSKFNDTLLYGGIVGYDDDHLRSRLRDRRMDTKFILQLGRQRVRRLLGRVPQSPAASR